MSEPSAQEIAQMQGTRLSDVPPWMSYAASFEEKLDPRLEAEIQKYSQHRHESTSSETKEELHRQKELSDDLAKQYQWLHPSEYIDEGARVGRIMHSSELINKLRESCSIHCWYRQHPQPRKLTLLVDRHMRQLPPEVGCWAQEGFMPEYSIVRFDDHGVPLDEKFRGWRTVLLQLIIKGILTEAVADRVFGKAVGPASERYRKTLYGFRNTFDDRK